MRAEKFKLGNMLRRMMKVKKVMEIENYSSEPVRLQNLKAKAKD